MCSVGPAAASLPGANDALQNIAGRPRFLDPEATRPLAAPIHRGRDGGLPAPQLDGALADAEADRSSRSAFQLQLFTVKFLQHICLDRSTGSESKSAWG